MDIYPDIVNTGRLDIYRKVIRTGQPVYIDHISRVMHGEERHLTVRAFKVGSGLGIIASNVTEQVNANLKLKESEEKYRTLIEESRFASYVVQDGIIVFANTRAATLFGFNTPSDLVGNSSITFIHPENREEITRKSELRHQGDTVPSQYYSVMITKDGTPINVEINVSLINWDGNKATLAVLDNIDERLKYEKMLKLMYEHSLELSWATSIDDVYKITHEKMKSALEGCLHDVLSVEGNIIQVQYSSDEFFSATMDGPGITSRAARTKATQLVRDVRLDSDYISGVYRPDIRSELTVPIVINNKTVAILNVESKKKDSFTIQDQQLLEAFAISISNTITRLETFTVLEERVKQRTKELAESNKQLVQMDDMKNQFISTATHELRTPVTSIMGYLDLMFLDPKLNIPDNLKRDIEIVYRNAIRLVHLTNDLLDAQRITTGKFEIYKELGDFTTILNTVVEELSPLFTRKNQELTINTPNTLEMEVDEIRIIQLLTNILRNANNFTPDGGTITLTVEPADDYILVEVKDTGVGLKQEDLVKLFKPFPGIRHGVGVSSTGLGLAICKGIVDMHDGEISVCSDGLGKGTVFTVKLPRM